MRLVFVVFWVTFENRWLTSAAFFKKGWAMRKLPNFKCDLFNLTKINFYILIFTFYISAQTLIKYESLKMSDSIRRHEIFNVDIHLRFNRSKESQSTLCRLVTSSCSSESTLDRRASELRSSGAEPWWTGWLSMRSEAGCKNIVSAMKDSVMMSDMSHLDKSSMMLCWKLATSENLSKGWITSWSTSEFDWEKHSSNSFHYKSKPSFNVIIWRGWSPLTNLHQPLEICDYMSRRQQII